MSELNAPMTQQPTPTEIPVPEGILMSGGVVVQAVVMPPPVGLPALVLNFAKADGSGEFHPPILFACDVVENFVALKELIAKGVDVAISSAEG